MLITLPRDLETDIMEFVRLNEIKEINDFLVRCLRDGYMIMKYGVTPKECYNNQSKPFEFDNEEIKDKEEETEKPKKKIRIIKK